MVVYSMAMTYRMVVKDVNNWPENICKIGNICENSVYYDHEV